jgi:hypothetical protein
LLQDSKQDLRQKEKILLKHILEEFFRHPALDVCKKNRQRSQPGSTRHPAGFT